MRVLITDDDPLCLKIMLLTLKEEFGHADFDLARNGRQALQKVMEAFQFGHPFDVVLLDIRMPGTNGQQVLKKIRAYEKRRGITPDRGTKIIMTSGLSDRNVLHAIQNDADGYFVKPVSRDDITREIRKYETGNNRITE